MAVMIFVNALSAVPGLPWWTYHAHEQEDVMTYVDMVFPCFLFIVGMSLPISVAHRLRRNPSLPGLWLHVLLRVIALVTLGLILANAEKADPSRMPMSGNLWALIGLISAALYLNVYPKSLRFPWYSAVLRLIGLAGVLYAFAVFRRTASDGQSAWIDPSYPEILGLIGFSYLVVAVLYLPTRRLKWAPALWFLVLLMFNIASTARWIPIPGKWPIYLFPPDNGAMASIVMAGVFTSQLFLGTDSSFSRLAPKQTLLRATALAIGMLVAGAICMPLGISKIRATPTWALWSIGASILLFTFLYWLCDLKGKTRWAMLLKPAGSNTLLTYLLPDLWYFLFAALGVTFLDTHITLGWPAVVKTLAFTIFILLLSSLLTRLRFRLQL
jgi:predicted acyltransferase